MKTLFNIAVSMCVLAVASVSARAQEAVPPPMPAYQPGSDAQLDELLGPIALYPDPLIAQILAASTLPTEIVMADRYVGGGGNPDEIDQQPWDFSVRALARYPSVLQWMDQNLDWTTEVGQAFLNQQQDVMDSIQRLRQSAYNFGNLQSTPQEQVIIDGGYIEIVPVNTQVIYVPVYQPAQVYYQAAYGSPFVTFSIGFTIGSWLDCDFDWGNHNIIVWNRAHPRPPNWWHEPPRERNAAHVTVWRPENNRGVVEVNRGDRGWGQPQPVVATVSRSMSDSAAARRKPEPAARPEAPASRSYSATPAARPAPVEHAEPVRQPESNGAFIGIQSPQETRAYSNRGQQSLQATHPLPPSRPAPASGGGGGNGSNSKKWH